MLKEIFITTQNRYQLVDITERIEEILKKEKIEKGILVIFVPHSTAGIVLTENESGLKKDWLAILEKMVMGIDFFHNQIDDNADSHLLSGLIGQSKTLLIENGKILLGIWQQIFLA